MWPIVLVCDDARQRDNLVDILFALDRRVRLYCVRHEAQLRDLFDVFTPMLVVVSECQSPDKALKMVALTHRNRPTVPLLVEVPSDHPLIALQALGAGATDYLKQPVAPWEWQMRCQSMLDAQRQKSVIVHALRRTARSLMHVTIREVPHYLLSILTRTDMLHDAITGDHDRRTGQLARLIADNLGLPTQECQLIQMGAGLHDIGKIGIPDKVLNKQGEFTADDHDVMRAHPQIGFNILKNGGTPTLNISAEIALTHHERYDGSGYPNGLARTAIPLSGRIAAVADVFDALAARAGYRKRLSADEAITYIRTLSRTHFDPDCVEALRAKQTEAASIVGESPASA